MADVVTYAQNREDLYIASFFPDVEGGFYVDVGAHHPVRDSVTKYFSSRGWTGINIEPQREYHELLVADRPKDVNLNMGISDAPGILSLREFPGGGLSTFSDAMKSEYEKDEQMRSAGHLDYDVTVETLANVLAEHVPDGQTIHFLKVDVEGLEYQVFRGNDWSRFRPILLCVEANHIVQDWRELLAEADYEKVFFDGLNEYFLAKEHLSRVELFAFVDMFLASTQIWPLSINNHIADLHDQIHQAHTEVAGLNAQHAEERERHAEALRSQTEELRSQAREHAEALRILAEEHEEALKRQAEQLTEENLKVEYARRLAESEEQVLYWRAAAIRSWGGAMAGRTRAPGSFGTVLRRKLPWRVVAMLRKVRRAQRAAEGRARATRAAAVLRRVRNARRAQAKGAR
ncbi:FkbM family methyltransferase [Catellatospora citrea]|uniref:Methyltransferase FkbM domain-containing protein n=1 Tax=Catellatospora citrea TaxID=53366 RepID=A0A8J3KD26_9ACTN|nr:FkbM family methyltransferase [Catellatospora citrea]RKE08018.1 FkbM family methyltransferase [Catellatospora citrea]GIF98399.1 hypothetical protein Cci01nite_34930 [Catellatospora citrea]